MSCTRGAGGGDAPPHGKYKDQHANSVDPPSDSLFVFQQAQPPQQIRPVVFTTAYEREQLGACITNIYGDVPKILTHPPQRDRRRVPVSVSHEVHDERGWHDNLK